MEEQAITQIVEARSTLRSTGAEPRRRLDSLFDDDSFVEYGPLAGVTSEVDDDGPADGLVTGVGEVDGNPVVAAAYDRAVRDGTQSDKSQKKLSKQLFLAHRNRWPLVVFLDGDGARRDDPPAAPPVVVYTRGRFDTADGLAELSGWAPTIAVICGRVLDGHASLAFMCDVIIAVEGATIGGTSSTDGHMVSRRVEEYAARGEIDLVVADEAAAAAAVHRYLGHWFDTPGSGEPSATADQIGDIVPDNRRRPYDMRKLIDAFADDGGVLELGRAFSPSMITCLARLGGRSIGIFANQPFSPIAGAIDGDAADKAARFVELCDAYELPLVSFIDNPGYMVGPDAERGGIARHHARPLSAIHHRTVPLYSVQVRKAYGLGPYAMSGFGSSRLVPELRLAWPSVESGGMSLEGAASLVKRKEIRAAETPQEARAIRDGYAEQMRDAAAGVRAGRTYAFDDVILPGETRDRIAAMLHRVPRRLPDTKKHPIDPR